MQLGIDKNMGSKIRTKHHLHFHHHQQSTNIQISINEFVSILSVSFSLSLFDNNNPKNIKITT